MLEETSHSCRVASFEESSCSMFPHGSLPSHCWLVQFLMWPFKHFETTTLMEPTVFSIPGTDGARHLWQFWKSSNKLLSNTRNFLPNGAVSSFMSPVSSFSSTPLSGLMSSKSLKVQLCGCRHLLKITYKVRACF